MTAGALTLHLGDSLDILADLPSESVDAVVTDPPYGIRFMGKEWDGKDIEATMHRKTRKGTARPDGWERHDGAAFAAGTYDLSPPANRAFQAWVSEWGALCLRVLKPGGHLLTFGSPRTYHRLASGIEDAGFEIRDQIMWVFGSGFPKSHNLEGEWDGWGTALKPAHEPIVVARKSLIGTVAHNVRQHGTGALNIGRCRVATEEALRRGAGGLFSHVRDGKPYPNTRDGDLSADRRYSDRGGTDFAMTPGARGGDPAGRWPANLIHDGSQEVRNAFPDAPGQQAALTGREPTANGFSGAVKYSGMLGRLATPAPRVENDRSAARFFYCPKSSRKDRNEGCELLGKKPLHWSSGSENPGSFQSPGTEKAAKNHHPTVKPTELMRYLCRLVTPAGGCVLDPFMGSGSTGKAAVLEGFRFIGVERESEYFEIAKQRIEFASRQSDLFLGGAS